VNRLRGTRCYLCGAMDLAADFGIGWRKRVRQEFDGRGVHWLDPTRKPIRMGVEDEASREQRRLNKQAGAFELVRAEMKPIRGTDLRMVNICDWMLVNIDIKVHACGTYREVFLGLDQGMPMLFHIEQGVEHTPDWLFAEVPWQNLFSSWGGIYRRLHNVDQGWDDMYNDWYFFDWMGDDPSFEETS